MLKMPKKIVEKRRQLNTLSITHPLKCTHVLLNALTPSGYMTLQVRSLWLDLCHMFDLDIYHFS